MFHVTMDDDDDMCTHTECTKGRRMKDDGNETRMTTSLTSLYTVVQDVKGKQSTIKMDRNILQRLITAYRAGREINLSNILLHELMSVPLSLATTNGTLHSPNKSQLADILTKDVLTQPTISLDGPSCLLIDGQALAMALSKPPNIKTFGEYADFCSSCV